jgi:hypothetical protein
MLRRARACSSLEARTSRPRRAGFESGQRARSQIQPGSGRPSNRYRSLNSSVPPHRRQRRVSPLTGRSAARRSRGERRVRLSILATPNLVWERDYTSVEAFGCVRPVGTRTDGSTGLGGNAQATRGDMRSRPRTAVPVRQTAGREQLKNLAGNRSPTGNTRFSLPELRRSLRRAA